MQQLATWMLVLGTVAACHHDTGKACTAAKAANITIVNVDDSAPAMLQIYKHAEADPAATRAGIKAEIDTWQGEGQPKHTAYYLTGPDQAAITTYVTSLPPEIQPPSSEKLMFQHTGALWRSYLVSSTVLDGSAIASVEETTTEARPALTITFTDDGKQVFAAATEKSVGHKMATIVDGEVTSAPVINGKISGGKAMITFSDKAEADALAKKLGC